MFRAPLLVLALVLASCTPKTDLGQPCGMTKPCDDDDRICELEEKDMPNESLDYMSLGSTKCDDLVCVRTANTAEITDKVSGFCTRGCINNDDCAYDYRGVKGVLVCDQLLLSPGFLDALKENDPATYDRVFGSGAASTYCVYPRTTPAK